MIAERLDCLCDSLAQVIIRLPNLGKPSKSEYKSHKENYEKIAAAERIRLAFFIFLILRNVQYRI